MAAVQGAWDMTEDRLIGASEIQELGWNYLQTQYENLQATVHYISDDVGALIMEDEANNYKTVVQQLAIRVKMIMMTRNTDWQGPFQIVQPSSKWLYVSTPDSRGHQLPPSEMESMIAIVGDMRQLAQQMEADPMPSFRDIGYSLKIIASNIQHCLHNFSSQTFMAAPYPATRDYPYGPQGAMMRCALEISIDCTSLRKTLENTPQDPTIKKGLDSLVYHSGTLIQLVAGNSVIEYRKTSDHMRKLWDPFVQYMLHSKQYQLQHLNQRVRDLVAMISQNMVKLQQFVAQDPIVLAEHQFPAQVHSPGPEISSLIQWTTQILADTRQLLVDLQHPAIRLPSGEVTRLNNLTQRANELVQMIGTDDLAGFRTAKNAFRQGWDALLEHMIFMGAVSLNDLPEATNELITAIGQNLANIEEMVPNQPFE